MAGFARRIRGVAANVFVSVDVMRADNRFKMHSHLLSSRHPVGEDCVKFLSLFRNLSVHNVRLSTKSSVVAVVVLTAVWVWSRLSLGSLLSLLLPTPAYSLRFFLLSFLFAYRTFFFERWTLKKKFPWYKMWSFWCVTPDVFVCFSFEALVKFCFVSCLIEEIPQRPMVTKYCLIIYC